jgi:hypothetical protein
MSILQAEVSQVQTTELPAAAAPVTAEAFAFADIDAEIICIQLAKEEFAGIKARLGDQAALAAYFNPRVSRWANSFSNKRLAEIAYTLGSAMNGETHSRRISVNGVYAGHAGKRDKVAPHSLREKYMRLHKGKTVSYEKLCRYLAELESLGIATRTNASDVRPGAKGRRPERQTRDEDSPGGYRANTWHVDFSKVVRDGAVVPHCFAAEVPGQAEILEKCTRDASQPATQEYTQPATHSPSSLQLHTSSPLQQPKTEEASLSEEKTKTEELGTCRQCDRPAEYQGPGVVLCGQCLDKFLARFPNSRQTFYRPEDGPPVRPPDPEEKSQEKSQDVENDYWVYFDGEFHKESQHDQNPDRPGGVRLVHLTRDEGAYLWGPLVRKFGQAPNSTQRRFMAWKAFGKELPPGMPKLPKGRRSR